MGTPYIKIDTSSHFDDAHYVLSQLSSDHYYYQKTTLGLNRVTKE